MMFTITNHQGMRIEFENGWAVSIQIGPGNYCDNHDTDIMAFATTATKPTNEFLKSTTAETAVINPAGNLIAIHDGEDTVQGYQTTEQVLQTLIETAARPEAEATDGKAE